MANLWRCYFANHYDGVMRSIETRSLTPVRRTLLSEVTGRVLEIGSGTGANLPLLPAPGGLRMLTEPDGAMRAVLRRKFSESVSIGFALVGSAAEQLPLPSRSFDTVIATLVLCSVQDPGAACLEIRRVLRPGGSLLFMEHVRGTGTRGKWQDRLQPLWSLVGCGCRPNRETVALLESAGLRVLQAESFDPFAGSPWLARPIGLLLSPFVFGVARKEAG